MRRHRLRRHGLRHDSIKLRLIRAGRKTISAASCGARSQCGVTLVLHETPDGFVTLVWSTIGRSRSSVARLTKIPLVNEGLVGTATAFSWTNYSLVISPLSVLLRCQMERSSRFWEHRRLLLSLCTTITTCQFARARWRRRTRHRSRQHRQTTGRSPNPRLRRDRGP